MTNPVQVETAFRADLTELLTRWNTSIDIEDISTGWEGSCVRMVVYIPNIWNEKGEMIQAGTIVHLGYRSFP